MLLGDNKVIGLTVLKLRVRDLEGSLEVEKSANAEANRAVERLTKQIRLVVDLSVCDHVFFSTFVAYLAHKTLSFVEKV